MNDYKYFIIAICVIAVCCTVGEIYSENLKQQEKQKQLEIKRLELLIKLKEK